MAFDYLNDTFGKYRNRETRFTPLEKKAVELLTQFVDRRIGDKDFVLAFGKVGHEFLELTKHSIDEDTPLWLNTLLGGHYVRWCKVQRVKWYFEEHPDELVGETKERFDDIMSQGDDEHFRQICETVLHELSTPLKNNDEPSGPIESKPRTFKEIISSLWQRIRNVSQG